MTLPDEAMEKARRVNQTVFGPQGNCQSACLAMILGIPLVEIPNFAQLALDTDDNIAAQAQTEWLLARGFGIVTIVKWQALPWPPKHGFYIAGGNSKRGNRHGVVFKDGTLWHDPHPDRTGIESVDDVDIIYPLALASSERRDAERYRWLRALMTRNLPETWKQVEEIAAVGCWEPGWPGFDLAITAAMKGPTDDK